MDGWMSLVFDFCGSAHEIVVGVEVVPDALAHLLETVLIDQTARVARRLGHASTILQMRLLLHLANRSRCRILLSVVERVVLLRDLQTEDGVPDQSGDQNPCTHVRGHLRSLQLEMHGHTGIGQLKVHIFVHITCSMGEVVSEIVSVHVVVMNVAATVLAFRL